MALLPLHDSFEQSDQSGLTLVSWNVLNKNDGPDIVVHLSGLAARAAGIDIFCLQEVPLKKPGSEKPVPELIEDTFGAAGAIAIAQSFYRHIASLVDEGNATFSSLPIASEEHIQLSENDPIMNLMTSSNRRVCLLTSHDVPGWQDHVTVANTHLSFESLLNISQRKEEMDRIVEISRSQDENLLLVGDFNAEPESALIKAVTERLRPLSDVCEPTHLSRRYLGRLAAWKTHDYIFATPDLAGKVATEDRGPSDHRPLVAKITKR